MVHPYDNPEEHFKFIDDDKTLFDKTNSSPEAIFYNKYDALG